MTKADLIEILAPYPDDTMICDGKGYELRAHHIREIQLDDWSNSTPDGENEIPGVTVGIAIGRVF